MIRKLILSIGILAGFLAFAYVAHAATEIQVVLDASSSMGELGAPGSGKTKFQEATDALTGMLQTLPPDMAIGLRLIGGSPTSDCFTSNLIFAPQTGQRSAFQDQLASVAPAGTRALYQAISDAAGDFPSDNLDHIMLIITDAADACQTDSRTVTDTLQAQGTGAPRIVMFGIDLTTEDRTALGQFVGGLSGRLTEVASSADLGQALITFAQEFANNVQVHLQDSTGLGVKGDITITNITTGQVAADTVDLTDFTTNLPAGTYQVTAHYLGQEISSDQFTIAAGQSKSVSLTFTAEMTPFDVNLTDSYGTPLRARITFINSANVTVLTTDFGSSVHVDLPADTYTIEVRLGDRVEPTYGVVIGPGQPSSMDIQVPIELAALESEVSNKDGDPINGEITVTDKDGTVVDHAPFSSYLYSKLPPGTYEVDAKSNGVEGTQTITLGEGDQEQVAIELDIPLGELMVKLRTESGNDAWGFVRVYDSNGNLLKRFSRQDTESPDWTIQNLPVGTYRVEATVEDVIRTMSDVAITANQETDITITFPDTSG